jgi:predicted nucleic acid-binding protein
VILVDTSAWVDFFRGAGRLSSLVDDALDANDVALCGPVITELRRGLKSRAERAQVLGLLGGCHLLAQPDRLWEESGELGFYLARKGVVAKSMDLLIACYALAHELPVMTADSDFSHMKKAGIGLDLVAL